MPAARTKEGFVPPSTPPDRPSDEAHEPARRDRRLRWAEAALIAALALTLNLAGNGRTSLWDRDEPRYAGCTREMRARGDWVYPTFNAEPRFHKPILIYWLMRAGYALGGDNPFGARLVSAIAGTATCLLVLSQGRRMLGPRAGLLAALMLTTAPIMVVESKLATTDATLTLFLVAGQFCLWELSRRDARWVAASFWLLMGLATLTKGPVGLALIACAAVASWWWGGPTSPWRRLRWEWGVPLFLLVTAPWFVAIGVISRGDFFRFAVGQQIAARVTSGIEQHGAFPGYYVLTSLLTFHPWSALLPAALYAAWARRKSDPTFGFLLGWVVGPLLLLEVVKTKLVHYYLPAYPACALLVAWAVGQVSVEGVNLRRWPLGRLSLGLFGGVGLGVAATLAAGAVVVPAPLRWPLVLTAAVIASGTLAGLLRLQRAETVRAVLGLAATWAFVLLAAGAWVLPAAEPYKMSRVVGEKLAEICRRDRVEPVLLSFQEPTVVYAMNRPAPLIRTWPQFYDLLDRHGTLVTAIIPLEWPEFVKRFDHLDVDVRETLEGFNLNKGQKEYLRLALIRRKPPSDPALGRASSQQLLVK
jgi:4-amino-4-deoxy-L-arabinose transferase-like glycosyltransferase